MCTDDSVKRSIHSHQIFIDPTAGKSQDKVDLETLDVNNQITFFPDYVSKVALPRP